jgi:hypothetical protein
MSKERELRQCAASWEPGGRLLGNVTATEIIEVCDLVTTLRSARDTARADVKELADHWQAEIEQHSALQAKVARAVAALKSGKHIEVCIAETLEALQ